MRSKVQAGAPAGGSFPISDATEEGEIQPCNTSDPTLRLGGGKNPLPDPSRQLAGASEACDLIKIIVLMQRHKCQEEVEGCAGRLCSPRPRRPGTRQLQGHRQTAQPFSSFPSIAKAVEFSPEACFF